MDISQKFTVTKDVGGGAVIKQDPIRIDMAMRLMKVKFSIPLVGLRLFCHHGR
jgi:hypothetical protein